MKEKNNKIKKRKREFKEWIKRNEQKEIEERIKYRKK